MVIRKKFDRFGVQSRLHLSKHNWHEREIISLLATEFFGWVVSGGDDE